MCQKCFWKAIFLPPLNNQSKIFNPIQRRKYVIISFLENIIILEWQIKNSLTLLNILDFCNQLKVRKKIISDNCLKKNLPQKMVFVICCDFKLEHWLHVSRNLPPITKCRLPILLVILGEICFVLSSYLTLSKDL